jgi:outer membrane PBP1 activator LpoA protein
MLGIPRLIEGWLALVLHRAFYTRAAVAPDLENGSRSWQTMYRRHPTDGSATGHELNDLQRWRAMAALAQEGEGEKATLASFVGSLYLLKAIVDNEDDPAVLDGLLSFYEESTGEAAVANALRIARPIIAEATRRGIFQRC